MEPVSAIISVIVLINIWSTHRVSKHGNGPGLRKALLIIGVWIIPFWGAWIAFDHARPSPILLNDSKRKSGKPYPDRPSAPSVLSGAKDDFFVTTHMNASNGIPILDWKPLRAWAESNFDEARIDTAIEQGRRAWLLHLRDVMGPQAHLYESDDALILSNMVPGAVKAIAEYVSITRRRILRVLLGVGSFPSDGKSIFLLLDNKDDYYHYVSIYYPEEGEFAFSGGMFIDAGCPHFVAVRNDLSMLEPVITHEMAHLALSTLRLPKWLDEGIAVNTEYRLTGPSPRLFTSQELHQKHKRFWDTERIQEFWSGKSFDRTDEGNMLSYELARIIVEQLAGQWENFSRFVKSAERQDAGAGAARDILEIDLGFVAAALLEQTTCDGWSPNPESWKAMQVKSDVVCRLDIGTE